MEVNTKHFNDIILPDNEEIFLGKLLAKIESVDELSHVQVTKIEEGYHFRIAPSVPKYNLIILSEILDFCNIFALKLDLSKSIKSSVTLNFKINYGKPRNSET